jgi:DNA-directed RNA polymerase subunit K/omega
MEARKSNPPVTTITRDVDVIANTANGNIYEAIAIASRRANQISQELKEELNHKLEEFSQQHDTLEEVFENREQIEISRHYEKLPKPTTLAIEELLNNETYYRKPEEINPIL